MSKGILQLAATGRVALQLEYRELKPQLQMPDGDMEATDGEMSANRASLAGTFELIYGEY